MEKTRLLSYFVTFMFFCGCYTTVQAPYKHGDIILGGLFRVHQLGEAADAQCGEIDTKGLGLAQCMIFAVEKINNNSNILPNITLGYDIWDYCGNITKAARIVYSLFNDDCCSNIAKHSLGKKSAMALIGPVESRTALFIGGFLRMLNVSGISGVTTSAELSSPSFNHLFRTVPSDALLAKAMVDIIEYFNWSYVAAVGLDDSYGRNGIWSVVTETASRKSRFCIAMTEFVSHENYALSITNTVQKLKGQDNIKVVMLWMNGNYQRTFFSEVDKQNLTGRVWIISEIYISSNSQENDFLNSSFSILEGSIGFQPHAVNDYEFKTYIKDTLTNETNLYNTFPEWSKINSVKGNCSDRNSCQYHQTEQYLETVFEEIYSASVPYTIDAVYSVAHALDMLTKDLPNETNYQINRHYMHGLLSRVNFHGLTGRINFDKFGDRSLASYDIFNFQQVSEIGGKSLKQVLVGRWEMNEENEAPLIFHGELRWKTSNGRIPKSECSELCPPGARKSTTSPCCWHCVPCPGGSISPTSGSKSCIECPRGRMSNQANTKCVALPSANISYDSVGGILILAFGTFGVVVTLVCFAVICKFWNSPIVKASNRELSLLLILAISSLFSLIFINVFEPTDTICKVIYTVRYLTYNFCLSLLLVKALLICSAFQVPIVASLTIDSLSNRNQTVIVIALKVSLLIVLIPWLLLDPPVNTQHIYPELYSFNECKAYSGLVGKIMFLITCSFIFVQMFLSAFCSFKVRNIPENFSESKRTAFSLYIFLFSLLCYHPVELSIDGWYVTVVDCVTTLLVTYGFLCCIFLPKIYILLFRPELNNLSSIRQEVTQFSFSSSCERANPTFDSANRESRT